MKKIVLLFLTGALLLTGCSGGSQSTPTFPPIQATEVTAITPAAEFKLDVTFTTSAGQITCWSIVSDLAQISPYIALTDTSMIYGMIDHTGKFCGVLNPYDGQGNLLVTDWSITAKNISEFPGRLQQSWEVVSPMQTIGFSHQSPKPKVLNNL